MSNSTGSSASPDTFRLGLTLAGAVSAGAYSAGVLDFLREALDAWEAAKLTGKDSNGNPVPMHKVQIQAISGTSAGAMCAAMFVGSLGRRVTPVNSPSPVNAPSGNPLYEAWVNRVDIDPMLDDDDLLEGGGVKSILNCRILDSIAQETLPANTGATFALPPWVADNTELFLCTTSLRGIPYNVSPYANSTDPYAMNLHAGVMTFQLSNTPFATKNAIPLHPGAFGANWDTLRTSALASGAFPFALKARITDTPSELLRARRWEIPEQGGIRPSKPGEISPVLPGGVTTFTAVCVDGGAINNEPVEHVRLALQERLTPPGAATLTRLPRDLDKATAATLLIDPFPDTEQAPPTYEARDTLFSVLKALLPSIMNQLRFKADELVLAASVGVGSRYMISPSRPPISPGTPSPSPNLACGELSGFLGFLDRSFRHHDYLLGRMNCQRFLSRHFYMDARNPVFTDIPAAYTGNAYFNHIAGDFAAIQAEVLAAANAAAAATGVPPNPAPTPISPVPVIPLMPHLRSINAAIGAPSLLWPHYDRSKLDRLERRIRNRMDAILGNLLGGLSFAIRALFLSGIAKLLRIHPAVVISKKAREKIVKALNDAAL